MPLRRCPDVILRIDISISPVTTAVVAERAANFLIRLVV